MFTGIIEHTSPVLEAHRQGGVLRVTIGAPARFALSKGQSVAIDGICSTLVSRDKKSFAVEYMPQTLARTTAGSFAAGRIVNLERPLTLSNFVDGHLTQGHVDARGRVKAIARRGESRTVTIALSARLMALVAPQGSVAINGVSLTVASAAARTFRVALIPYTLTHTNLGNLRPGDAVNIEVDLIARYVAARARRDRVRGNAAKKDRKKGRV